MTIIASFLLFGFLVLASVAFIYFGPGNWFLAFAVGFLGMGGLVWLLLNYPGLLAVAGGSSPGARAGAEVLTSTIRSADDVEGALMVFVSVLRWALTLLFGVPAVLLFLLAMWGFFTGELQESSLKNPIGSNAYGLINGVLFILAGVCWLEFGRPNT